jgi:hypothetical protein
MGYLKMSRVSATEHQDSKTSGAASFLLYKTSAAYFLYAQIARHSNIVFRSRHSRMMLSSSHHHCDSSASPSTKLPQTSFQSARPIVAHSSISTSDEVPSNAVGSIMLDSPIVVANSNPASANHEGTSEHGLEHRKSLSRLVDNRSSIQEPSSGPIVFRAGAASITLISRSPPGASNLKHSRNSSGNFADGTREGKFDALMREKYPSGYGSGTAPNSRIVRYDTLLGKVNGR